MSLDHEEDRWASDREDLNVPLLALFLGPTSSLALGNRGRAHWRWLWINIVYPAAMQGTSTEQEVETQRG